MNKKTFFRNIIFNNEEVQAEFLQGNDSSNLIIFLPPSPNFGGSFSEHIIEYMFSECQRKNLYALRINYTSPVFDRIMLQTVMAIEEAKLYFSATGKSIFRVWLVGVSMGATVAFLINQRRIDIEGVFMISPILKDVDWPEVIDGSHVTLCYSDKDPLTSLNKFKEYVQKINPKFSKCFNGANHTMSNVIMELSQYIFDKISQIEG